jgi:hypothetical protein
LSMSFVFPGCHPTVHLGIGSMVPFITEKHGAGGEAQVVELLPSKYEGPSSNSSAGKKKKRTRVAHQLCKLEALISNPSPTKKKRKGWSPNTSLSELSSYWYVSLAS